MGNYFLDIQYYMIDWLTSMVNIVINIQSVAAKYNINNNANKQKQEMRENTN